MSGEARELDALRGAEPHMWVNPHGKPTSEADRLGAAIDEADDRLARSSALLSILFPSLRGSDSPLRSPLEDAASLANLLAPNIQGAGRWWVKADHALPIAGSIKARGGFHEIIALAERLAIEADILTPCADLAGLASSDSKSLFGKYTVVVGSTGNLGMSIGLMAAALGFKAIVHMSNDAKAWKKQRLRDHGATVVEHSGDYALAVERGRQAAQADPFAHFVDDEQSVHLFAGYGAAARELAAQLEERGIVVDEYHPLFVYIPCGVGGAPGGVTYGLKRIFGDHVHCFFAEPVQSPCMLVQLASGMDAPVSVYDIGLTNRTEADGLAVGLASPLVAPLMRNRLGGIYTVSDEQLNALFRAGQEALGSAVEPSAAAAFAGPVYLLSSPAGRDYIAAREMEDKMNNATHLLWTTGGSLIPGEERQRLLDRAARAGPFTIFR